MGYIHDKIFTMKSQYKFFMLVTRMLCYTSGRCQIREAITTEENKVCKVLGDKFFGDGRIYGGTVYQPNWQKLSLKPLFREDI